MAAVQLMGNRPPTRTSKGTKRRVLVGPEMSEEFSMNIDLRSGSALTTHVYHGDGAGKQEG